MNISYSIKMIDFFFSIVPWDRDCQYYVHRIDFPMKLPFHHYFLLIFVELNLLRMNSIFSFLTLHYAGINKNFVYSVMQNPTVKAYGIVK